MATGGTTPRLPPKSLSAVIPFCSCNTIFARVDKRLIVSPVSNPDSSRAPGRDERVLRACCLHFFAAIHLPGMLKIFLRRQYRITRAKAGICSRWQ